MQPNSVVTKKLNNIIELAQLKISSIFPTRITALTATCLDIIAINRNYKIISYEPGILAVSDHLPAEAEIEFELAIPTLQPTYSRNFNKIDYTKLNAELSSIRFQDNEDQNAESMLQHWMSKTQNLLDKFAPLKAWPARKDTIQHMPQEIKGMIYARDRGVRKSNSDPNNGDWVAEVKTA